MDAKTDSALDDLPEGNALRVVDIADLATATLPQHKFWIEGILPAGVLTLLGGHGGVGKSIATLTLAAHLACGATWAGLQVIHARVLFGSLEDDGSILRWRLKKICQVYHLPVQTIIKYLTVVDGSQSGALVFERLTQGDRHLVNLPAMGELDELSVGSDVLIVDNASEALDANENDRRMVRTFVQRLGAPLKARGGAVLLNAHVGKDTARAGRGTESYSGSTAWHNSARSRLTLVKHDSGVVLEHHKSNLGPTISDRHFNWTAEGVLIPSTAIPLPKVAQGHDEAEDDVAVLRAIQLAADRGIRVPTATSGQSPATGVLAPLLTGSLKTEPKRVNAAINRLHYQGQIDETRAQKPDRKWQAVWVPAANAANAANAAFAAFSAHTSTPCGECGEFAAGGMGDSPHAFAATKPQLNGVDSDFAYQAKEPGR